MNHEQTQTLTLPSMGEGQVEARITALLKTPGEPVACNEVIYEMETDKARIEIESPVAGILREWRVELDQTVAVGAPVAEIGSTVTTSTPRTGDAPSTVHPAAATIETDGDPSTAQSPAAPVVSQPPKIPPRTREYIRALALDADIVDKIPATGRFLSPDDVDNYLRTLPTSVAQYTDEAVSGRQAALNDAMRKATGVVVAASVSIHLEASLLTRATAAITRRRSVPGLITEFQVLAYCAARAAAHHRALRSRTLPDNRIRIFPTVNIGISVSTVDGDLHIAGLADADTLSFEQFHHHYTHTVEQALHGTTSIGQSTTLLVSYLGDQILDATPIVVPPAVATLFLTGPHTTNTVRTLILAIDHCVLNGYQATRYLGQILTELRHILSNATGPEQQPAPAPTPSAPVTANDSALRAVHECAEQVLGHRVDPHRPISELGIDSAAALAIISAINTRLDATLSATTVYHHATLADIATEANRDNTAPPDQLPSPINHPDAAAGDDDDDAIAIVGVGCRFPGGIDCPEEFWRIAAGGHDTISEFPQDRGWDLEGLFDPDPDTAGKSYVTTGGFLSDAAEFDADFFGISPREATSMDPQQRVLLETVWETLERAGIAPESLRGSDTGVFVGVIDQYYGSGANAEGGEGYRLTGKSASVVSGRIAYVLGLQGPAISVDTACSSSLVALHQAAASVRSGECGFALAAGVTVMATPAIFVEFSRQRGLSVDGRCKSFAAAADGTGFAEGAGVLAIERLSQARRLGHEVWAVIRGSAINQDGASNGLTAPSGRSQQQVIRQALAHAGLSTHDIDAVEAHGTGTTLGDPIEAHALLATYGQHRPTGQPLWLGSIKSNIGHTQAAAGIAGVIKMIMAMRHEILPPTLHVDQPTPYVDWASGSVRLLTEPIPWPYTQRPRRAGVSSFGVSGTNAHVILEQAPAEELASNGREPADLTGDNGKFVPWLVSGNSNAGLHAQAARLSSFLNGDPGWSAVDIAFSLATTRANLPHRAVIFGQDREQLIRGLGAVADGKSAPGVFVGQVAGQTGTGTAVFVFPGQGSQWVGMGTQLLESSQVFRAAFLECAGAVEQLVEWSVLDALHGELGAPSLERVDVVQPLLFTVMVALAELWRSYGVEPAAVVGHSQGEIAAAYVAGALSVEDAAKIVVLRSQIIARRLAGLGGLVSVPLSSERVTARWGDRVTVAAVNGPSITVIAGGPEVLDELIAACAAEGVTARRIPVDYASHSPEVQTIRDELLSALSDVRPRSGRIPFYSTVTGTLVDTATLDAEYWFHNLRHTVEFAPTIRSLIDAGHRVFVEASPHPVLTMSVTDIAQDVGTAAVAVGSLRRNEDQTSRFLSALAELFVRGTPVDWSQAFAGVQARRVGLPTYAFQRKHFWLEPGRSLDDVAGNVSSAGLESADHPLLGAAVQLADGRGTLFTGQLSLTSHPWLAEHAVHDTVLVPGAALVELTMRAGDEVGCNLVDELTLESPLVLSGAKPVRIQVVMSEAGAGRRRSLTVHSRHSNATADTPWIRHASGTLTTGALHPGRGLADWPPSGATPLHTDNGYDRLAERGYGYGPVFRGLRAAWRRGEELFAEVALPEGVDATGFGVHPALLDAALHVVVLEAAADPGTMLLPFSWTGVSLHATGASTVRVHITQTGQDTVSVRLSDHTGAPVLSIDSLVLRPLHNSPITDTTTPTTPALHELTWTPAPTPDTGTPDTGGWVALTSDLNTDHRSSPPQSMPLHDLPTSPDLSTLMAKCPDTTTVIWAAPVDSSSGVAARVHALTADALNLLQQWVTHPDTDNMYLILLTRHAVVTDAHDRAPDPAHAAVWGLTRTTQTEHPYRHITILDLPDTTNNDDTENFIHAISAARTGRDTQYAWRRHTLLVPRLTPTNTLTPPGGTTGNWRLDTTPPRELDPVGTVLITGGTGTLGGMLAKHLVRVHGVRHLLLASRQGPAAPDVETLCRSLTDSGAQTRIVACDTSDRAALSDLLATIPVEHPLTAVIHTAAVLADTPVTAMTGQQLHPVLTTKFDSAWHLHELTQHLDLTAFVLYSSIAGTLGSPGQANYTAANAALDALAHHRHQQGLPAISIAWGYWQTPTGLTGHLTDTDRTRLSRTGLTPLDTEHGLTLFDHALTTGHPTVFAAPLDTLTLTRAAHHNTLPPLLSALINTRRTAALPHAATRPDDTTTTLANRLSGLPLDQQHRHLIDLIATAAATALGHPGPDTITADSTFKNLGVDSLTALELRNTLTHTTGLTLTPTLIFDHPTPAKLATWLLDQLSPTTASASTSTSTSPIQPSDDPVVVVGMACRYPQADSADALWGLVVEGVDAMGEFPPDRGWDLAGLFSPDPDAVGKTYTHTGAFLPDAAGFDNAFFGISPREALAMDPQQRLLMEVSWEALEAAGIDPSQLAGTHTGVFAGTWAQHYGTRESANNTEGYALTGTATSVASGRIAYTLGLQGPAITIDTACSSSLVAVHLACQSLRSGESNLALAGGVTVITTPSIFAEFARQRGLAPDGRCKAFAAAADGTGWGEGAGMLVLERLSDAQRKHHPILAVIAGSAVNSDGASNGLTAPNGPSQQRVITQALINAALTPAQVDLVEAHGTGTTLGDPIEAAALHATYGRHRPTTPEGTLIPLRLGSIKSNIGHTQAAAGVAGIIKTIQALRHGILPKTLHINQPTPHVDWDGSIQLATTNQPWPHTDHPRTAAVSGFGISGTNAHLILQQPPTPPNENPATITPTTTTRSATTAPMLLFPISAATPTALPAQAARLRDHLDTHPELDLTDIAYSLATTRTHHPHRATITIDPTTDTRTTMLDALQALAIGQSHSTLTRGTRPAEGPGKLVFVFPGQGAQHPGMSRDLYHHHPAYARALDQVCAALESHLDLPSDTTLREIIHAQPDTPQARQLNRVEVVQPALFAVMVALAELLDSFGITPDAVIGHSQGEIAAAHIAGALTLDDAATVVTTRSRAVAALTGTGTMASILSDRATVTQLLQQWEDRISIAAVNGPTNTTVAGDTTAITEFLAVCERDQIHARRIPVDYPSHSPHITTLHKRILQDLNNIHPQPASTAFHSTIEGHPHHTPLDTTSLTADYWYDNLRQTVDYHDTVTALLNHGPHIFLELSPHPLLTPSTAETTTPHTTTAIPILRKDRPDTHALATALAQLHNHGHTPHWHTLNPTGHPIPLPTYPFQHNHYWVAPSQPDFAVHLGGEVDAQLWTAVADNDAASVADSLGITDNETRSSLLSTLPAWAEWRRTGKERAELATRLYRETWLLKATPGYQRLSGTWLVVVPSRTASQDCIAASLKALRQSGADVRRLDVDNLLDEHLVARLSAAIENTRPTGVLALLPLADVADAPPTPVPTGLLGTVALIQALEESRSSARLWCVTQTAVVTSNADVLCNPVQAAVWGLGRTTALELSEQWGGLIDLPKRVDERTQTQLGSVLADSDGQDELALRAAGVFVRRLSRAAMATVERPAHQWNPTGTVLITGGTGALGAHTARWLAHRGAEHLVLVNRRGMTATDASELHKELADLGATVVFARCDVADRDALASVLDDIPQRVPLSAVMHCAGVVDDSVVQSMTAEQLAGVLRPKLTAAVHLHELTQDLDLSRFVMFSSMAGMIGSSGQANYGAANAFLDAFAQYRRAQGLPATSLAWGWWAGNGMGSTPTARSRLRHIGFRPMEANHAISAMAYAVDRDDTVVGIADVDWNTFISQQTTARPSPAIIDLAQTYMTALSTPDGRPHGAKRSPLPDLSGLAEQDRRASMIRLVCDYVATVLDHQCLDEIDPEMPFKELGFDSLTTVELRNHLAATCGLQLPTTALYDHPSPVRLGSHLAEMLHPERTDKPTTLGAALAKLEATLDTDLDHADRVDALRRLRTVVDRFKLRNAADHAVDLDLSDATSDEVFAAAERELDEI